MQASSVRIDSSSYSEDYKGFDFAQAHDKDLLGSDHALRDRTVFPYTLYAPTLPYFKKLNSNLQLELGPSDDDEGIRAVESDHGNQGIEMV